MQTSLSPIVKGLTDYKNENITRFHMPGHYGKHDFPELKYLCDNILEFDVTEVEGTDNLNEPTGIILDSLNYIKDTYNSKKSYILVNGSTSGIHIAIDTLVDDGAHVITARNCHKSVYNILDRKNTFIHYIYPKIDETFCIDSHIEYEDLIELLNSMEQASIKIQAVILTYPNYFGRAYNLKKISELLLKKNIYLIIDEAHGAHFPFHDSLPKSSLSQGSTICIQSAHKTLPSLTQTSMLHLGDSFPDSKIKLLEDKIQFFQTTSPSYIFTASCEIAVHIMNTYGHSRLENLKEWTYKFNKELSDIPEVNIFENISNNPDICHDFCKIGINTPIPGNILTTILRNTYKIQAEMSIGFNVLFMVGISHTENDLLYLKNSIIDILKNNKHLFQSNFKLNLNNLYPKTKNIFSLNLFKINEKPIFDIITKKIDDIDNDICAERVIPYPPGIPLLLPYEIINDNIKQILKYYKFSEIQCFSIG